MSDATTYAPEISDLGEKIVSLTLIKAVELADYLEKVQQNLFVVQVAEFW